MPKTTLSFHHPLFRKDAPDLCKDMNMGPGSAGCATAAPAPQAAEVTKEEAKPAPVETTVEVDSLPSASPAIQVLSMPAVATAPAISLPPPHNPVAALNLAGLAARPPPAPASGLQAIIEQMRAQVAADAANKDRLLREALAAEQQRTALLAQANNNNNQASSTGNPLAFLETLTSLMSAGQPSVAPNAQLLALARALASPPALPVPPAAPPAQPPQPPAGSLLQLLTPAQQLELLTKLAGSK